MTFNRRTLAPFLFAVTAATAVAITAAIDAAQGSDAARVTADTVKSLELRSLGPMLMTGRVADLTIDPNNPKVYYVAAAAGGLWKSENHGDTWTSVFDNGGSFNMCCVVVDPKDSHVVWLGTGENSNPRSAMYGDGVYKSTDAAKTWTRVGLEHSEHIGNIEIDPRNSNVVYVAAQGPLWSSGGDRGLYKTIDGGETWKTILTVSPDTGATQVVIDPNNPDVLYASMWQRRRSVGQFVGGGPESGLYKSLNAGATWTKLATGLPTGPMGRIALAVDPKVKPTRVYALITALRADTGFYRSDDAGATFTRYGHVAPGSGRGGAGGVRGGDTPTFTRAGAAADDWYRGADGGYFGEIFADRARPDTIWSVNTNIERSEDGGKTFSQVPIDYSETHYGGVWVDFHAVWTDPSDRNHYLIGNDGGAYETWDDGRHFRHFLLPVTQFYRVATDNATPFYHVCGGAQDNDSMCGPSRTPDRIGIRTSDWYLTSGGDGFFARIDPTDANTVYQSEQSGAIYRLDLRTGVTKSIRPRPPVPPAPAAGAEAAAPAAGAGRGGRGGGGGERVNWDCPFIISPHSHTRLYWGSTRLYRTDDRGDDWRPVSPDLTRDLDPARIPIMGKLWDPATTVSWNQSTTPISTIVSIDESPLLEGLLYVGTDDGLLQVSEDAGQTWRKTDVFPGVPDNAYISKVFASPRDADVVFVAFNNWQRGDFKPYLLKSADRGRTFTSIVGDLPQTRDDIWTFAQDQVDGNLFFAGTEFALYFTNDAGSHWVPLKGMPTAQVRDLTIQQRETDLVLATFGRGFFVLDDFSPLREIGTAPPSDAAELLPLRHAYEYTEMGYQTATWGNEVTANPPVGAVITYNVRHAPENARFVLTMSDQTGRQVRRLDSIPQDPGAHRVVWNLRPDPPAQPAGGGGRAGGGGGRGGGPPVELGLYTVTLGTLSGEQVTPVGKPQRFAVLPLPAKNY